MIKLNAIADDDPLLDQSKLLYALEQTIQYAEENSGIGLTQTKLFNRKFAHWGARNFNWPTYSEEKLLRVQRVLNEWDVPPVMVVHDVMTIAKWGRHVKGKFQLSKSIKQLALHRGQLFGELTQQFLFRYNHGRMSRIDFQAPGDWRDFLNIINVEAHEGMTEPQLVKALYGMDEPDDPFEPEYQDHRWFLSSEVLRPLCWMGFHEEIRVREDRLADCVFWKTPLWSTCFTLDTDHYLVEPTKH
ncbi:hypothetical protein MACH17_01780 [Phaeobacter inhibens]|uniref:hypothetical protein n=1 Tax=Phaeobacter inhibens TaxID=221822 RepID=UPI00275FE324|nr:hypothetical protein [Phaeobacter inhibens]GLO68661.1 hypothetical protein MACH17_01780 [Phaeobacter inhibens]